MGAHSTMIITEEDARLALIRKIMKAPRAELETMMDSAFDDKLFNFRIVSEYDPEYGEVSVHVQMFEWRGFWKRLVEAVKFLFRSRRSTGWDYCILKKEDYPKLLAMLKVSED